MQRILVQILFVFFSFERMVRNKTSVFRIYAKCPWGCFAIFRFMKFPPIFLYLESLPTCYNSMFNFHWGRINYQCTYQECKKFAFFIFFHVFILVVVCTIIRSTVPKNLIIWVNHPAQLPKNSLIPIAWSFQKFPLRGFTLYTVGLQPRAGVQVPPRF